MRNSVTISYLFMIITLLFPKAGVTTSSLPITIATLVYSIAIIANIRYYSRLNIPNYYICIYLYLIVSAIITVLLNLQNFSAMNVAYMVILLASPISFTFGQQLDTKTAKKIISLIVIIIGLYSIVQLLIGVQETAIRGLTIAYGDDFSKKQIIRSGWVSKIPSTYTNGTLLAPSLLVMISFLFETKSKTIINYIALILGFLALLLSGSRSTLFVTILTFPVLIYKLVRKIIVSNNQTIMKSFLILSSVPLLIVILYFATPIIAPDFINQIYNAYIGFTKNDSTFSGRTTQWLEFYKVVRELDLQGVLKLNFIGLPWNVGKHLEGLPLIFKLYGFIPFTIYILFTFSIFLRFRKTTIMVYALISLFIIFMIDGSVLYPPTLMNIYMILGIASNRLNEENEEK